MNQTPEQLARDRIDKLLFACGWIIQNKSSINLHAGIGIAVREYQTDVGPADYVLFVDNKPAGIIEAKRAEEGVHLTVHEEQSKDYAERLMLCLFNCAEQEFKISSYKSYDSKGNLIKESDDGSTRIGKWLHLTLFLKWFSKRPARNIIIRQFRL
jgi:type I site-specific restriction endonuclease